MSEPRTRVDVCRFDELTDGQVVRVRIGKRDAGAVRLGDRVSVFADRCPHHGGPLANGRLSYPLISDCPGSIDVEWTRPTITCPWHGWQFDLQTGCSLADPKTRAKLFDAEVVEGRVVVYLRHG